MKGDRIGKIDARHMCIEGHTIKPELWKEVQELIIERTERK